MPIARREEKTNASAAFVGVVLAVGALHVARDIFVPVAIAILLSFLLAPMVRRLSRWHLPNVIAVMTTVIIAFSIIGLVGWLVSAQFLNLVENLPLYQENLRSKISVFMAPGDSAFTRAGETIEVLRQEIEDSANGDTDNAVGRSPIQEPLRVVVQPPEPGPFQTLRNVAGPVLGPLGTAGLSLIFVIFILLQRYDLRDRFIKLVSGGNINLAMEAVDDATHRISRYLLMHSVINITYGIPVSIGLYFIGVPSPLLWGLLATLLRFIPFIGAWISALFPISLAFAVDPGWTMPILTIGMFITLELVSNNILEPWLYGTSTGISAVALIFAALVWTWIWGPVGLFLSTPLTVCLLVIGKNSTSLNFLDVILGSEPVLAPQAQMYQRMLAMDSEDMVELAEHELTERDDKDDVTLTHFYDSVMVPALGMAERDRHAGVLAERRQEFINQSTGDLLEDLSIRYLDAGEVLAKRGRVLCIPARDHADELSAVMLAQLLQQVGIKAEILELGLSRTQITERILEAHTNVLIICAIPPGAIIATRRINRIVRTLQIPVKVITGIWGETEGITALANRLGEPAPDHIATTYADALVHIQELLEVNHANMVPAPIPENEEERMAEVRRLGLLEDGELTVFDAITARLVTVFDLPVSMVSIIADDKQFWKSQTGLPADLAEAGESPRDESICGHLVASNELLVVEDLASDERFAGNPFVKERGLRFYAGAPLRTKNGHAVGTLCVMDTKPRRITEEQKWLLSALADHLMQHAENQAHAAKAVA